MAFQFLTASGDVASPFWLESNADEATVFGHNDVKTVGDYKRHLRQDTGQYSNEEFQLYPVRSDADVPTRSVRLESDEFACGAYSIAQAMTKAGERGETLTQIIGVNSPNTVSMRLR